MPDDAADIRARINAATRDLDGAFKRFDAAHKLYRRKVEKHRRTIERLDVMRRSVTARRKRVEELVDTILTLEDSLDAQNLRPS